MQNASYRPSDTEIAQLASTIQQPGFEIFKKIMVGEVDWFQIDLLNVDPSSDRYETEVRAKHSIALAAGMFYQRVTDKVTGYIKEMAARRDAPNILPDQTQDLLDY